MKHARFFLALLIVMIFTISPVGQTEPSAAERLDGFTNFGERTHSRPWY